MSASWMPPSDRLASVPSASFSRSAAPTQQLLAEIFDLDRIHELFVVGGPVVRGKSHHHGVPILPSRARSRPAFGAAIPGSSWIATRGLIAARNSSAKGRKRELQRLTRNIFPLIRSPRLASSTRARSTIAATSLAQPRVRRRRHRGRPAPQAAASASGSSPSASSARCSAARAASSPGHGVGRRGPARPRRPAPAAPASAASIAGAASPDRRRRGSTGRRRPAALNPAARSRRRPAPHWSRPAGRRLRFPSSPGSFCPPPAARQLLPGPVAAGCGTSARTPLARRLPLYRARLTQIPYDTCYRRDLP